MREEYIITDETQGIVFFYETLPGNHLREITRTLDLPFYTALTIYSETPNPASQLVRFNTPEEREAVLKGLQDDVHNPEWREELFACL